MHRGGSTSRGRGRGRGRGGRANRGKLQRVATYRREQAEIDQLQKRIEEEVPPPGSQDTTATLFSELPLSRYTMTGALYGQQVCQDTWTMGNHFGTFGRAKMATMQGWSQLDLQN